MKTAGLTATTDRFAFNRRALFAAGAGAAMTGFASKVRAKPFGEIVDEQPFARLELLAPGVFAAVSTPLNHDGGFNTETLCNGGLIVGDDKIVAIDGFFQPAGAAWLARQAQARFGRPITDVIVTHFHADHTGGLAGYQNGADGPEIIATETTHRLIFDRYAVPQEQEDSAFAAPRIRALLPTKILTDESATVDIDLGGRTLTLRPMRGHTPSDMAIEVNDAPVLFAGDLIWAGFFHNYVDAIPTALRRSVAALLKDKSQIIVTGHGYVAKAGDLEDYLSLLDHVEAAARAAHAAGKTPAEGAAEYAVPESLGEWMRFNPRYYEVAFEAWRRELDGEVQ